MTTLRSIVCLVAVLVVPFMVTGCATARQKCMTAVQKAYGDADKVGQEPANLDAYCAAWDDHPPSISTP